MFQQRKLAVVFGGSGFLGRYVVQRLARAGMVVRVAVRDVEGAMFLRPLGVVGQIVPLYAPLGEEALVTRAVEGADVVINLVGILAEARSGDFMRVHEQGAGRIARLAAAAGVGRLIQISAIGADAQSPSLYARSKAAGEVAVHAAMPGATILRPSIVFGTEDQFFNRFAAMATMSPVIPIVGGRTKFQPVYVGDVADAIMAALAPAHAGQIFELGGPEVKSFHTLIADMLALIERRRQILDMPIPLANLQASVLERLPGKLLTTDQVKQLGRDNVVAPGALGLADLGIAPTPMGLVLPSYLARYRPGGRRREAAFRS
jgi:NADH dehydrogenase